MRMPLFLPATIVTLAASLAAAQQTWTIVPNPQNATYLIIARGDTAVGQIGTMGWGPAWKWVDFSSTKFPQSGDYIVSAPFAVSPAAGQVISVQLTVSRAGSNSIALRYDLSADRDVPLTEFVSFLEMNKSIPGQFLAKAGGNTNVFNLPLRIATVDNVSSAVFKLTDIGNISVEVDPPGRIHIDGAPRFVLADEIFKAGKKSVTLTITFPGDVLLATSAQDTQRLTKLLPQADWFAFTPANYVSGGVIAMNDWLDRPAGKHGGVRAAGDHFQFEDGTPVKFWGTNLSYGGNCAPDRRAADFTAARFARLGVNAVRMHKFSYPTNKMGIGTLNDSTKMDPAGLDRLDYFASRLKENGVYFGWSHTYGFTVCPGDRNRLLAYDEIMKAHPDGNTYALINFAEDVQDLMIEMVVNLLKHKNPYTKLTYADEPALSYIELQNEDDIFFFTSERAFNACPTYRKAFMERFAAWLKAKYGGDEGLRTAWGALKPNESLAAASIVPQTNPWFFGDGHLPQMKDGERQRLLDTAAFLHEVQNKFYGRFAKAIRDAGYKGPITGSPWQAPSMLPHYYNLHSDYLAGYIDRHNYFGRGLEDSMLSKPGSGYFSSGLQQVIDRPFGLSEWIHEYPSLYSAEGPAIIAAYGMGLQGWDASYEFQSQAQARSFHEIVGNFPWGIWEADVPTQVGQYPALSRMILRGDVKESPVISVRRVSPQELQKGEFSFSDSITQQGDIKSFTGSVPAEALAAGRVVVQFADQPEPSTFPNMNKYKQGTVITSSTGQLAWDSAGKGYFTVNTDGTKAVVGFAQGKELTLGDVKISMNCPYASIFLTALDKQSNLKSGKSALLTAVARNCNTGFKYFVPDRKVIDNGKAPILLEPVKATIAMSRKIKSVNILDHDGRRTTRTLPVANNQFTIDGATDKTLYYEVVFE